MQNISDLALKNDRFLQGLLDTVIPYQPLYLAFSRNL